ncbi:DUF5605 domain-containing protein [Halalkalibacter sp. AB-rgal2]|uniref:DUF5605 domain-containing protein n=1 Tax=Halalkalibacter sp. AB-rgal2 TaxID=3242695 RepID=UPI00359EBF89
MSSYQPVKQWGRFELEFEGTPTDNPFIDSWIKCEFRLGNRKVEVDGFYDGGNTYKVRFMPDKVGEWAFFTISNDPNLDKIDGVFSCIKTTESKQGPVQVSETYHFEYADGTPFYPFGTTAYVWNHQGEELENKTIEALRNSPFNKIRMCVFPKHYDYNLLEPVRYPFEGSLKGGFDFTKFNVEFFERLEQQVQALESIGIEVDLILFHPYDRWGFSDMGKEVDFRYLKYIVARLSAYRNIWWSFANEYDLMKNKDMKDWDAFFKFVQEHDPSQHLRSIHNWHSLDLHYRSNAHWYDHRKPWVTHLSVQYHDMFFIEEWRNEYGKPVINDECRYEGDLNHGWGNITGEKMVEQFWEAFCRGGYATHGEAYLNESGIIWWSHGGELRGESPKRIQFLKEIIEEGPTKRLTPVYYQWDVAAASVGDEYILVYLGSSQPSFKTFPLPEGNQYQIELIDTWEMTIIKLEGLYTNESKIDLPSKPYLALRLIKK